VIGNADQRGEKRETAAEDAALSDPSSTCSRVVSPYSIGTVMKNSVLTLAPRRRQALPMLEGSGTRKLGGRDPIRASQRILSFLVVALFIALFPSRAHAYSWMIKHGYSGCPVCHADPSGGELLTTYGRAQSELLLRMHYGKHASASAAASSDSSDSESSAKAAPAAKKAADAPAKADKPGADDDDDKTDANSGSADDDDDDDDDDKPADAKSTKAAKADADAKTAGSGGAAEPAAAAAPAAHSDDSGDDDTAAGGFLWGLVNTPDWLLLGGSYRQLAVYKPGGLAGSGATLRDGYFVTFPMMADVYGQVQFGGFRVEGSLGVIRVGVGSPYGRAAQITTNQGDQWNLLSRTHWVGYDFDDGRFTVRGGHLNLPFGIRIPEHTMWVRQATRTDRESAQEDGVALAFNGDELRGEVMAIAGNYQVNPDKYRERGYSGYLEYMVTPHTALGVSSLVAHAAQDRISLDVDSTRQAHGVLVRSAFSEKTVLLAEADMLIRTNHELGYVSFAQLDFEAVQGLHFMLTGEAHDEGYDTLAKGDRTIGAGKPQLGVWGTIDWFCFSHVEVRADVYSRQGDDVTALGQLHVFL
jgi:hypothetical protein